MFRIDVPTAAAARPAVPAAAAEGFFTDGTTDFVPPTVVADWWLNMLQEELLAVVDAAGLAHDKTNTAQLLAAMRWLFPNALNAPANFYIAPAGGNDANPGTLAAPLATIGRAVVLAQSLYNPRRYPLTLHLTAPGTWHEQVVVNTPDLGNLILVGDPTLPGNFVIDGGVAVSFAAYLTLRGVRLASGVGYGVSAIQAAGITLDRVDFGVCAAGHIAASNGGSVFCNSGGYQISAGSVAHLIATNGGTVNIKGAAIVLTGPPAFSVAFASADWSSLIMSVGAAFSGSATGARYLVDPSSVIDTGGGGETFFPGDAPGVLLAMTPYR